MLRSSKHNIHQPNMFSLMNIGNLFSSIFFFFVHFKCTLPVALTFLPAVFWLSSWLLTLIPIVNWLSGSRYCFALSECSKESNHCFSLADHCCWFEILRPLRFLSEFTGILVQWWNKYSYSSQFGSSFSIWYVSCLKHIRRLPHSMLESCTVLNSKYIPCFIYTFSFCCIN